MKVYHIVYKTVNLINNKFYIGVHKSTKLTDEYLGSGKWIVRSIKKHGRVNFTRENLFIYFDSASAYGKEAELVSILIKDPLCMNIKQGGMGGFDFINENGLCALDNPEIQKLGSKKAQLKYHSDPEYRKSWLLKIISSREHIMRGNKFAVGNVAFLNKKHSEETKKKISEKAKLNFKGSGNSQYGTFWITKDNENKKIKLTDLQTWLDQGWERGRK